MDFSILPKQASIQNLRISERVKIVRIVNFRQISKLWLYLRTYVCRYFKNIFGSNLPKENLESLLPK